MFESFFDNGRQVWKIDWEGEVNYQFSLPITKVHDFDIDVNTQQQ